MRRPACLALLVAATACGGAAPVDPVPPPPPPPGSATGRPIFTSTAVGSGGGTIRYTKAGDPLDGLSITVPAGAYTGATSWTLVADSAAVPSLPTGFSQVGPTLLIGNGQGYASSNMTLTMPMQLAATETVAPFYFDPATNTLEGIPIVAATENSVTLATKHFSASQMAIPGSGGRACPHANRR